MQEWKKVKHVEEGECMAVRASTIVLDHGCEVRCTQSKRLSCNVADDVQAAALLLGIKVLTPKHRTYDHGIRLSIP